MVKQRKNINLGKTLLLMNLLLLWYLLGKTINQKDLQDSNNTLSHPNMPPSHLVNFKNSVILSDNLKVLCKNTSNNCGRSTSEQIPIIYIITPTHRRSAQLADITRFSQTLMHVPCIHWIVVEDAEDTSNWVEDILRRSGISYTYLAAVKTKQEIKTKVRGCSQRNKALEWAKKNTVSGTLYFADDDNSYDLRLFDELRSVQNVGILPTGNLVITGVSSPVVVNGKVVEFIDVWKDKRKFPVEMASIAINIDFWLKRGSPLFRATKPGYLETFILEDLRITKDDLEPLADNCTKIYVWHTQTKNLDKVSASATNKATYKDTNIPKLMESVVFTKGL